jgi:hypothetical protein
MITHKLVLTITPEKWFFASGHRDLDFDEVLDQKGPQISTLRDLRWEGPFAHNSKKLGLNPQHCPCIRNRSFPYLPWYQRRELFRNSKMTTNFTSPILRAPARGTDIRDQLVHLATALAPSSVTVALR